MSHPSLPVRDGPGGARSDTGGGAGTRPASHRWVGPAGEARQDPHACGWGQRCDTPSVTVAATMLQ
jgi:hypothetical protein